MNYDLSHLQQPNQNVIGIIQDDEALLLFALCKTMLIKNVVEVGTFVGYSARNFIKAVGEDGHIISIDTNHFSGRHPNFTFINKNVSKIEASEIPWVIDLIFFDCHDELAQITFVNKMINAGKIDDDTIIAVHDTNLHPDINTNYVDLGWPSGPFLGADTNAFTNSKHTPIKTKNGLIPQPDERVLVNKLIDYGWNPFHIHTKLNRHNKDLSFRNGLTLLSKKKYLELK